MKLNLIKNILAFATIAVSALSFTSCNDDLSETLQSQAYIEPDAFYVVSAADKSRVYKAVLSEDGTLFSIRLPQNVDPAEELVGATPKFFLAMGATCEPALSEPQDFTDPENPVVYTVTSHDGAAKRSYTVDYIVVEPTTVDFGEAFSTADVVAAKNIRNLGWTNNYYYSWDANAYELPPNQPVDINLGDIMGSPAFCGHDNIVVFARAYALSGQPDKAFKVFDPQTLEAKGALNLGSIDPAQVVAVASDWHGNMIAAVGRKVTGKSDLYIWTSPEDEPLLIGSTHVSVEIEENNDNAASYINVAGDLTRNAVIAFGGPRDADGTHYKYKVFGGQLNSDYKVIKTGCSSEDQYKFQMISYFGIKDSDPYLVGDCYITQKTPDKMEDEVGIYLNGPDGDRRAYADYYNTAYNGWVHDNGDAWWQRTGQTMKREGARRPTVHAMYINGRYYAFWTTGSIYTMRTLITDRNLSEYYTDYGCFWGFGKTTAAMGCVNSWQRDGYGPMADWYFDDESQHGYIALWIERVGLVMFEISCVAFL